MWRQHFDSPWQKTPRQMQMVEWLSTGAHEKVSQQILLKLCLKVSIFPLKGTFLSSQL